jgi:SAM-dependent MidA family methyltransferase
LANGATPNKAEQIWRAHHRLTAADGMGALFKVLSLTHPKLPVPAGFETEPAEQATP